MSRLRFLWFSVMLTCFFFEETKPEYVLYTRASNETNFLKDVNYRINIEVGNTNMKRTVADAAAETMKAAYVLHQDVASRLTYFRVNFHEKYPRFNWNTFENSGTYGFYAHYYVILTVKTNLEDPVEYLIFSVVV